jgi:hypothetical protein
LFLRECISGTQDQDVAFKLFFGRPALIVEHHELFEHPEPLVEIAARINSMAPEMHWSRLAIVAANSILTRRSPGGVQQVRAFSCKARISNESSCIGHYLIEWGIPCGTSLVEHVLVDGAPCRDFEIGDGALRLSVEIIPGCSREVSLVYRNDLVVAKNLGPRWVARAFVRRRLSEFRDNYLTKNQGLLEAAKAMQRRFLRI